MPRLAPVSRRSLALAAALVLTACGGGSDASDDGIDATDGSREAPEVEEAAVETTTLPPTTTTSTTTTSTTTTSTTTTTTTTTTLPPPPAVSAELCRSIGTFYTTAQTTDFFETTDAFAIEVTFAASGLAVDDVIIVADGDPVAAPWVEIRRLIDVINGLDAIAWDVTRSAELPNANEIADSLDAFSVAVDATGPFLIAECGLTQSDIDELDAASEDLFDEVVNQPPPEPISLTDDTGRITMTVPGTWTDIVTSPQGNVSRLAAAPDFTAFDTGFANEGGFVLAVDVADPEAWRTALQDSRTRLESQGCIVLTDLPYDDGVYTGTELNFDCGVPGMTADIIAARDSAGSIAVVSQIVRPAGDTTARDLIVESFLIS